MAHVFIVDRVTFNTHLKYQFAGTGSQNDDISFLITNSTINVHTEKKLISMYSDVARVKKGDKIIFYVTGLAKFYGVFKAESEVFIDYDNSPYLNDELGKKLFFRIKIKPFKVYSEGVSEYKYLDSTDNVETPQEMTWSLIYRKLKGNRGCTAINDFEFTKLEKLLMEENQNQTIMNDVPLEFYNDKIVQSDSLQSTYEGMEYYLDDQLKNKMIEKNSLNRMYEDYLQAFVIENLKKEQNLLFNENESLIWLGNEVSAGVGMQSIDVMAITAVNNVLNIYVVELKSVFLNVEMVNQINRYLLWLNDYILPLYFKQNSDISINVIPVLIGKKYKSLNTQEALEEDLKNSDIFNSFTDRVMLKEIIIKTFEFNNDEMNFN